MYIDASNIRKYITFQSLLAVPCCLSTDSSCPEAPLSISRQFDTSFVRLSTIRSMSPNQW